MTDDGPAPTLEATYVGPVIVNGGRRANSAPMQSTVLPPVVASPDLEKFPDVEMSANTYPFVPYQSYQFDTYQQPFLNQLHGQNPYFNLPLGPLPISLQHSHTQYQRPRNELSDRYQQRAPGTIQSSHLQAGQNNYYDDYKRGNGKGRGRGNGLPSFTRRPPPFPAQIGTPPPDAYAQWKTHHQQELGDEEAKLAAQDDETNYHTSFQTGSPKSGGNNRGKPHGRKAQGHQTQMQTSNADYDNNHAANQGLFGYGLDDYARAMYGMGIQHYLQPGGMQCGYNEQRASNPLYHRNTGAWDGVSSNYVGNNPSYQEHDSPMFPLAMSTQMQVERDPAWKANPIFPYSPYANDFGRHIPQYGYNSPAPLSNINMQYPTQPQDVVAEDSAPFNTQVSHGEGLLPGGEIFPRYPSTNYDGYNLNTNADLMMESEINVLASKQSTTNPSSSARLFSQKIPHLLPTYVISPSMHQFPF
jgi:hypothetical protein